MSGFLSAIWGSLDDKFGELRLMKDGKVTSQWEVSTQQAEEDAVVLASRGFDVYYGVLPRLERIGGGDSVPDQADVMWADFDGKAFSDKAGAFRALAKIAPEPQIVVDSGNGYHAYWLMDDIYPFAQLREVMKGFHLIAGADKTYDKSRILRVPGTLNYKTDPPNPVRILRLNLLTRRHRLSDFVDFAAAGSEPVRVDPSTIFGNKIEYWEPSRPDAPKFPEGTRNNSLAQVAGIMYARGMSQDNVVEALSHENHVRCDPPLEQHEVEMIARSIGRLHG